MVVIQQHDKKTKMITKEEHDGILYNITRSICPTCKTAIDAQIIVREQKVFMRKRCLEHGWFESLLSSDFSFYRDAEKFNKPGTIPFEFQTEIKEGCPSDCGLCSEHKQHTCLALLEITTKCNMSCPVCFAGTGDRKGGHLHLETIENMISTLQRAEGTVEIVQLSGGEPTLHPDFFEILRKLRDADVKTIMINSNGRKFASSLEFCQKVRKNAERVNIYLQFDGFEESTYRTLRGNPVLIEEKLQAIKNLNQSGIKVTLVMTVVQGINDQEIGSVVRFLHEQEGVSGLILQPLFPEGRLKIEYDPLDHLTLPDIIDKIVEQTEQLYNKDDFFPIPCPYPHCSACTFSYHDPETREFTTIKRLVDVEEYLDFFKNSALPGVEAVVKDTLEDLLSFSTVPGTKDLVEGYCQACGIEFSFNAVQDSLQKYLKHVKLITIKPFQSAWDMDIKRLMKCCIHEVLPDGRIIPFCAYNAIYREKFDLSSYYSANSEERERKE
ncbi:MAG: radical SAM protein [Candidatus Odinarchaeota archaeon]